MAENNDKNLTLESPEIKAKIKAYQDAINEGYREMVKREFDRDLEKYAEREIAFIVVKYKDEWDAFTSTSEDGIEEIGQHKYLNKFWDYIEKKYSKAKMHEMQGVVSENTDTDELLAKFDSSEIIDFLQNSFEDEWNEFFESIDEIIREEDDLDEDVEISSERYDKYFEFSSRIGEFYDFYDETYGGSALEALKEEMLAELSSDS